MYRMQLGVALAAALGTGSWWSPPSDALLGPAVVQGTATEPAGAPREPWLQGDPADSLYRAAREALNRQDFRVAADLFAQINSRFPKSGYAPDALLLAGVRPLSAGREVRPQDALASLKQQKRIPRRRHQGRRRGARGTDPGRAGAALGDPEARAYVTESARSVATPPTPPVPPTRPVPPVPPVPPDHAMHGDHGDDRCAEDDDDMKLAALNALIHMDGDKARPILQQVLARRDAASVCLRRKAVFLISQGDAEGAEDILLESARNDPDGEVREQAVFWLSQVGSDRAVAALDSILRTSNDRRLQDKAIFALSQQDSPQAPGRRSAPSPSGPTPRRSCGSRRSSGSARAAARRASAISASSTAGSRTRSSRRRSSSPSPRSAAPRPASGWSRVARDRTQPIELRKQALFWAGQGDAPMADLASLYNAFDDREMKDQLIFVYSQRDEPAAVDKLLEIARKRPRPRAPEEGALLAGPERRSPRRQGAPGHHRATVRRPPMRTIWWAVAGRRPCSRRRSPPSRWPSGSAPRDDGTVRLSFAAREGVCGSGPGSITIIDDDDDQTSGRATASGARCGCRSQKSGGRITDRRSTSAGAGGRPAGG